MAKGTRGRRRLSSRQCRTTPYSLPFSENRNSFEKKKCSQTFVNKDWEHATCSVCMEYPHNAVLLLCSSHDKGCRPYMCGTSSRYSNCLDQYKKAYTKITFGAPTGIGPMSDWAFEKPESTELACPLCRAQVKGWTVVEPARRYLDLKRRSCMQEGCSFLGSYKELRKHVRAEHPCAKPREVDPVLEQKWRRLERERERDDVISTITSSMPGAVVFGDYVIEGSHYGFDSDEDDDDEEDGFVDRGGETVGGNGGFNVGIDGNLVNVFLLLHAFGQGGGRRRDGGDGGFRRSTHPVINLESSDQDSDVGGNGGGGNGGGGGGGNGGVSVVAHFHRQDRVLLGQTGRRQRRGEGGGGGGR